MGSGEIFNMFISHFYKTRLILTYAGIKKVLGKYVFIDQQFQFVTGNYLIYFRARAKMAMSRVRKRGR